MGKAMELVNVPRRTDRGTIWGGNLSFWLQKIAVGHLRGSSPLVPASPLMSSSPSTGSLSLYYVPHRLPECRNFLLPVLIA